MASAILFADDDAGYLRWLANHPDGFVVNTNHSPSPAYMQLHRASCATISEYRSEANIGGFTERSYAKACADTTDDLRSWVRQHGRRDGSFTSVECPMRQPLRSDFDEWD